MDEKAPEIRLQTLDVSGELDGEVEIPENRFCTECIFEISTNEIQVVRDTFGKFGDSLVPIIAGGVVQIAYPYKRAWKSL